MHEILDIKGKMIDPKIFEKEVEKMPEILRKVVVLMSRRFHFAMEGSIKMVAHLEEATRAIDALSTNLIQKSCAK
ncbi:MAG TPA: hypothetical protein ACFYEJ_12000 [Candidatus Wujingus californicus]|uniref:hypothetical protein n=1 Tax=Candidatus Wujingus californicus TaxID=3367618 RepID=UPI001DFBE3D7|nr:hypothetical protein [Planctomycetota bacterium]MDO8132122.1 hypothetical protein [Candidatus Brocadiales bacterium]